MVEQTGIDASTPIMIKSLALKETWDTKFNLETAPELVPSTLTYQEQGIDLDVAAPSESTSFPSASTENGLPISKVVAQKKQKILKTKRRAVKLEKEIFGDYKKKRIT
ncbi:hypothetical protein C0J52_12214 [Blattella germanica]|nr:hypothetical protein C0J52_12214 [Blattella germanica]